MARLLYFGGRRMAIALALLFLLAGCGSAITQSTKMFPSDTGFVKRDMFFDGSRRSMWIFVPRDYTPSRKYPAIVFLHGLFEAGSGSDACLTAGLGPVIARRPADWPFITIFPQSTGTWKGEVRERQVMAALAFAQQNYSIDENRVILAGLSYGALGTWEIGARNADKFAALVPVSGHRPTELVERLAMLPVWAFAMTGDMWVSSKNSEEACAAIAARGGKPKLTEFGGVGHDIWDRVVAESNVVDWMLAQRRSSAVAGAGD